MVKQYKSRNTNGITVQQYASRTFDGTAVPMAEFCKAVKLVSQDLGLTADDVVYVIVTDLFAKSGCCRHTTTGRCFVEVDCDLEGNSIFKTVAHELRHAWQDKNGMLEDYSSPENILFNDDDFQEYLDNPMEVDARDYAKFFVRKYRGRWRNTVSPKGR